MQQSKFTSQDIAAIKEEIIKENKKQFFWNSIKMAGRLGIIIGTFAGALILTKGVAEFINTSILGND